MFIKARKNMNIINIIAGKFKVVSNCAIW